MSDAIVALVVLSAAAFVASIIGRAAAAITAAVELGRPAQNTPQGARGLRISISTARRTGHALGEELVHRERTLSIGKKVDRGT